MPHREGKLKETDFVFCMATSQARVTGTGQGSPPSCYPLMVSFCFFKTVSDAQTDGEGGRGEAKTHNTRGHQNLLGKMMGLGASRNPLPPRLAQPPTEVPRKAEELFLSHFCCGSLLFFHVRGGTDPKLPGLPCEAGVPG